MSREPLKRILGTSTALLVGMGVAIGSGIFRVPGEVALHLQSPGWLIVVWTVAGFIVLMQGMVTAELATRYPKAGGEYVYLKNAYGEFIAFFFGWAFTIFILGGGAALIALALGDFGCELFGFDPARAGLIAAGAIIVTTAINSSGLVVGAGTQNVLTVLKIVALVVIIVVGLSATPVVAQVVQVVPTESSTKPFWWMLPFLSALVPALWPYQGTTDSAMMAEEIKDVRRALPRALIGSTLAVTALYVLVTYSLMRSIPPVEMAGRNFVPGDAMARLYGESGRRIILIVAMLACLGSLSSTVLACVRVPFALARDGLAFAALGRMSKSQSPVAALLVVGGFAIFLVLNRDFSAVLYIYFFAAAILFGLTYASLIVFRVREQYFPAKVFRCPFGVLQAAALIAVQIAIAVNIAVHNPKDVAYTMIMLIVVGMMYFVWKKYAPRLEEGAA